MMNALAEHQAAAIREKFIEAGRRSGRLGPYSAPYSREDDGGLIVFLSHERAYLRLHPATTEGERARVKIVGLDDCGRRRAWAVTVLLSWDAARVDWRPWDSASIRDVAAELWNAVETAAIGTGWVLPAAEGPESSTDAKAALVDESGKPPADDRRRPHGALPENPSTEAQ